MGKSNSEPIIRLDKVSKIYQMGEVEVPALREVDLEIQSGDLAAIVGPSGSGKTTLMNIIGCLDLPTEGTYYLHNRVVTTYSDARLSELRGEGIGFVFQNYNLLANFTVPALSFNDRDPVIH